MRVLVDTNVFARFADSEDARHAQVTEAVRKLRGENAVLGYTPQVRREFWNIATRPKAANGLGWEPELAGSVLHVAEEAFIFWDDVPGIAAVWWRLVSSNSVHGVQVHDANHAAAAMVHGASHVLTLDVKDFDRYARFGLTPFSPVDI